MRKSNTILFFSIFLNILLVALLCYLSFVKTDVSKRIGNILGICQYVPIRADNDCVLSWNNTIKQLNYDADVVFFGNSITAGGDFQSYFNDKKVINLGYIGEDTKGMLRRVEQIKNVKPEKVFLMAGINGLKSQDLNVFEDRYRRLVDSILCAVPDARLYIQSILPVCKYSEFCNNYKINEANKILTLISSDKNLIFIDLYSLYQIDNMLPDGMSYDGLHLNPEAYNIWYKEVKKYIE